MTVEPHPDYAQELGFLDRTLRAVDAALDRHTSHAFEGGANPFTNRVLNSEIRADILERLEENRFKPYFARLDYQGAQGLHCVYFGYAHVSLPHGMVLDWRCDLYSLYVGTNARAQSYTAHATGKKHKVELLLKRRLDIADRVLLHIHDAVDRRALPALPPAAAPVDAPSPEQARSKEVHDAEPRDDSYLIRQLYSRGDPRLQDIVETIQAQQDAIIRAPLDRLLLLHGVAGSGKTSIAYHRLAYLMYPDHGYHLHPRDLLVIGPNPVFLGYVRDLLPSLGVTGITQRTFQDWAWRRMRTVNKALPASPAFTDTTHDALHDPAVTPEQRTRRWTVARLKGELRFRTLLERYVADLAARPPLPKDDLVFEPKLDGRPVRFVLTPEMAEQAWLQAQEEPGTLAGQREAYLRHAARRSGEWFRAIFGEPASPKDKGFVLMLSREVRTRLGRTWRPPSLPRLYAALFDAETLERVGVDLYTPEEQALLATAGKAGSTVESEEEELPEDAAQSGAPKGRMEALQVDLTDVPGLYVLHGLLYGNNPTRYRHVVLDEAQDFSALQVQVLLDACPTASMTIVGDTAQGIHAYRGIQDWDELIEILPGDRIQRERITQNYRSTREIVTFGNAVQRAVRGDRALDAEAVNRTGAAPHFLRCVSFEDLLDKVTAGIHEVTAAGLTSVAVIAANDASARALAEGLQATGTTCTLVTADASPTPEALGGITVMPAALTKGLEFQAVLVADGSETCYPSTDPYAGSLLYVAVSRALHALHVYSLGAPSRFLQAALATDDRAPATAPSQSPAALERVRSRIPRSLVKAVTIMRREGVPMRLVHEQLAARADDLAARGGGGEVLSAYHLIGQFGTFTTNELLRQLYERGDDDSFLKQAHRFGAPAVLEQEIETALRRHETRGAHDAAAWRKKFADITRRFASLDPS